MELTGEVTNIFSARDAVFIALNIDTGALKCWGRTDHGRPGHCPNMNLRGMTDIYSISEAP